MQSKLTTWQGGLGIEGSIRVKSGKTAFRVVFADGEVSIDFPSVLRLLGSLKKLKNLASIFTQLPPLPGLDLQRLLSVENIFVTVRGRRLGSVFLQGQSYRFKLEIMQLLRRPRKRGASPQRSPKG